MIYGYKLQENIATQKITLAEKLLVLNNSPSREILQPTIKEYLLQHKIYVALTTTPNRIKNIHRILAAIDQRNITNILLAIPHRFSRTNEKYNIPTDLLRQFPKLKVLQIAQDLGPITKLIPAAEYVKAIDPESIIITIDDDVVYPFGMVNEMIYQVVLNNAVVGGIVDNNISKDYFWSKQESGNRTLNFIDSQLWWRQSDIRSGLRKREFVIGFGAIAYKVKFLDTALMLKLSQLDKSCFQSDDLVISYALHLNNIDRAKISNKYLNSNLILPLDYGSANDALHKLSSVTSRYQLCNSFLKTFSEQ